MHTVVVVTAVRAETRAALAALRAPRRLRSRSCPTWQGEAGNNRVVVVQAGVGWAAAARAVETCAVRGGTIVSLGFAGALAPELTPGSLLVPRTVVWEESGAIRRYEVSAEAIDAACGGLPLAVQQRLRHGALLSSPVVLASVTAKLEAALRYEAIAVEMEAAALVRYASTHDAVFFALRAVLDPAELSLEGLPSGIDVSWRARARLALMPGVWPLVRALSQHAAVAAAALRGAAARVLAALPAPAPVATPPRRRS